MGKLSENEKGKVHLVGCSVCTGCNHECDNHSVTFKVRIVVKMETAGGDNMPVNLERLSDAQNIADSLVGLPKEALLYIAGYAEGCRDRPAQKRRKKERTNGEQESRQ
jgi:hypothetical protein